MKNLIITLLTALLITQCGTSSNSSTQLGTAMKTEMEMKATTAQLDSICVADTLPDYNKWVKTVFTDYETKKTEVKMIYVKENNGKQTTYVIIGNEEPYEVTKRITK